MPLARQLARFQQVALDTPMEAAIASLRRAVRDPIAQTLESAKRTKPTLNHTKKCEEEIQTKQQNHAK